MMKRNIKERSAGFTPPLQCVGKRKLSRAGFTLIELMMVAVLVPVVALAIYSNFSAGVKIWTRLHQETSIEELNIFNQKGTAIFNATFRYATIPFETEKNSISFAAFIDTDEQLGGDRGIGQVKVFYDPSERAIKKEERNLNRLLKEAPGRASRLLGGVTNFKMSYFVRDREYRKFIWIDEWVNHPKEELPLAVRFDFKFNGASGERHVKSTFLIPTGGTLEP